MERFASIQYLRAVAALMVVMKHSFRLPYEYVLGYGVDLFFVISGFVMVASTQRPTFASEFLSRRAWRILPMWWLTLLLVGTIGLSVLEPNRPSISASDWLSSALLIPYKVENDLGWVAWGVGWTLCFEMLFYLIFAIGLRLRNHRFAPLTIAGLAAIGLAFGQAPLAALSNLTHPLLLEFLLGLLIARVAYAGKKFPWWLIPLGLCLLLVYAATLPFGHQLRVLTGGVPMALILAGFVGMEEKIADIPPLHFLGDASYSIYLLHYVPIMLFAGVFGGPVLFLLAVGFGCLAYWWIERPILDARAALRLKANKLYG